jgi:hypothetical protein
LKKLNYEGLMKENGAQLPKFAGGYECEDCEEVMKANGAKLPKFARDYECED